MEIIKEDAKDLLDNLYRFLADENIEREPFIKLVEGYRQMPILQVAEELVKEETEWALFDMNIDVWKNLPEGTDYWWGVHEAWTEEYYPAPKDNEEVQKRYETTG